MARGWESKAVEEQQSQRVSSPRERKPKATDEQIAVRQQEQNLQLSRKHLQHQLAAAKNPRHRKMLEIALAEIESRIAGLG